MKLSVTLRQSGPLLRILALGAALALGAPGCGVSSTEQTALAQDRQEIERLRQENQDLAKLRAENEEVQRLRKENQEISKLRGQYQELVRLRRENEQLRNQLAKIQTGPSRGR